MTVTTTIWTQASIRLQAYSKKPDKLVKSLGPEWTINQQHLLRWPKWGKWCKSSIWLQLFQELIITSPWFTTCPTTKEIRIIRGGFCKIIKMHFTEKKEDSISISLVAQLARSFLRKSITFSTTRKSTNCTGITASRGKISGRPSKWIGICTGFCPMTSPISTWVKSEEAPEVKAPRDTLSNSNR